MIARSQGIDLQVALGIHWLHRSEESSTAYTYSVLNIMEQWNTGERESYLNKITSEAHFPQCEELIPNTSE